MSESNVRSPRTVAEQAAAISSLLVQACVEYLGRGPTRARTTIGPDIVTVVLDDGLTRAEKSLVANGHSESVLNARRLFQSVMAEELIRGVEEITGRQVHAFLSDNHIDPDIAVETFVLRPEGAELPREVLPDEDERGPDR